MEDGDNSNTTTGSTSTGRTRNDDESMRIDRTDASTSMSTSIVEGKQKTVSATCKAMGTSMATVTTTTTCTTSTRSIAKYTIGMTGVLLLYWLMGNKGMVYRLDDKFYKYIFAGYTIDSGLKYIRDLTLTLTLTSTSTMTVTSTELNHLFPRITNETLRRQHSKNGNDNVGSKIWPACQVELYTDTVTSTAAAVAADGLDVDSKRDIVIDINPLVYIVSLDDITFEIDFVNEQNDSSNTRHKEQVTNQLSYDILNVATERFLDSFQQFVPNTTIPSNRDKCTPNTNMSVRDLVNDIDNENTAANEFEIENERITKIHFVINSIDSTLFHGVDESYNISIPTTDYPFQDARLDPVTNTNTNDRHVKTDMDTDTQRHNFRQYKRQLNQITHDHSIYVYSQTIYGALRSLQTIKQLLEYGGCIYNTNSEQIQHYFFIRHIPIEIVDYPSYMFRGLMIDTSRHYFPMSLIVQNLDAMELNKLNVLHWHMTDSQSWPYTSDTYPELSQHGAFCPSCTYSSQDVKLIMKEAQYRGIQLIMEYDLPGHSLVVGYSHPEFLTNCSMKLAEPLDVTKDIVITFIDKLYTEISSLYDYVETKNSTLYNQQLSSNQQHWVHIGGDEVPTECWDKSESVRKYMNEHNIADGKELLYKFELNLLETVKDLNLRPIVWQELFNASKPLPMNTIIDVWQSSYQTPLREATEQGYDIVSSYCYYMDHLYTDWTGIYDCNFLGDTTTEEQRQHVLGGHACMWAEKIDPGNFFPTVYPRTSAMAERLWTTGTSNSNSDGVFERLQRFRCLMVRHLRVTAAPIGPDDCYNII